MKDFLKKWVRWECYHFVSVTVCIVLIIGFGALAGTFWPGWAWGSTAIFTFVIIGISAWLG